jgi:hypothetical protein
MKLAPLAVLSRGFSLPARSLSPEPCRCVRVPARSPSPVVGKPAHDAALHFLARPKQYPLTDAECADLIQVVEGYTSPHDHDAARRGIEWMREQSRRLGQTPRF